MPSRPASQARARRHSRVTVLTDRPTTRLESTTRQMQSLLPADCVFAEIGFGDLELSSWSMDYGRYQQTSLSILADTSLAVPELANLVALLAPAMRRRFPSRDDYLPSRKRRCRSRRIRLRKSTS